MCIRDRVVHRFHGPGGQSRLDGLGVVALGDQREDSRGDPTDGCLLYTSDAADERSSVDLGGRRIIKKNICTRLRRVVNLTRNNIKSHRRQMTNI